MPAATTAPDPGEEEESEGEMAAKAHAGELFHLYHARLKEYRDIQSQLGGAQIQARARSKAGRGGEASDAEAFAGKACQKATWRKSEARSSAENELA